MLTVYLDVCCLNRPFDDQSQARVHLEAEAVLVVLERINKGIWEWVSSSVVDLEIEQNPDAERKARTRLLALSANRQISVGNEEESRARELVALGFHAMDALHLACAEIGQVDVFLTTDDRLLRRVRDEGDNLKLHVMNPLRWIEEVVEK